MIRLCRYMRGGLSYTEAINMPLPEFWDLMEHACKISRQEAPGNKGK